MFHIFMCNLRGYIQIRESEDIIKHSFLSIKHYIIIIKTCLSESLSSDKSKVSQK